jgi:hypothetical protein
MRFDSSYKTAYNTGFRFDSNIIRRRNRNKKNEEIEKEKNYFWEKNGLLRVRQNRSRPTVLARPKSATAITITKETGGVFESLNGHWLLQNESMLRNSNKEPLRRIRRREANAKEKDCKICKSGEKGMPLSTLCTLPLSFPVGNSYLAFGVFCEG